MHAYRFLVRSDFVKGIVQVDKRASSGPVEVAPPQRDRAGEGCSQDDETVGVLQPNAA